MQLVDGSLKTDRPRSMVRFGLSSFACAYPVSGRRQVSLPCGPDYKSLVFLRSQRADAAELRTWRIAVAHQRSAHSVNSSRYVCYREASLAFVHLAQARLCNLKVPDPEVNAYATGMRLWRASQKQRPALLKHALLCTTYLAPAPGAGCSNRAG